MGKKLSKVQQEVLLKMANGARIRWRSWGNYSYWLDRSEAFQTVRSNTVDVLLRNKFIENPDKKADYFALAGEYAITNAGRKAVEGMAE